MKPAHKDVVISSHLLLIALSSTQRAGGVGGGDAGRGGTGGRGVLLQPGGSLQCSQALRDKGTFRLFGEQISQMYPESAPMFPFGTNEWVQINSTLLARGTILCTFQVPPQR